jgi:hypothetical protein
LHEVIFTAASPIAMAANGFDPAPVLFAYTHLGYAANAPEETWESDEI